MKKVVSILLVLVMLLSTSVVTASAAYENTYSNTGNQRADIIGVAKTQVGNTNGLKYRSDGASWCAAFIVWCARQANISSSIIKDTGWATADDLGITYYGRNADRTNTITYVPKSGDVIIFDWSSNGYCYKSPPSFYGDHVGLVEYVENGYVYTIEGNSGSPGAVRRKSYSLSSSEIKGYGVPNYKGGTQPVSHTIDSNYGKNFTAYPKSKITAANIFDANHNQIDSTSWIGTSDKCTIHEVYTDGCCKVTYPLDSGGTKIVYSKISLFNVNINECTGYNIAYSCDTENGKLYDSCNVTVTITPHVNNRDAYDSEISSIYMFIKYPNGKIYYIDFGKNKSQEFYMGDCVAGTYTIWAKVETIYGSSEGAEDDGSLSFNLTRLSWTNTSYESEVTYRRIQFEGLDRYLTVNSEGNVVSSERQNSSSSDQSQIWKLIKNSDGTYIIQSVQNNKVLDVSKGSYSRGTNVLTYTSQGSDNQKWYLSKDNNGNYFIRAAMSNSAVLDVDSSKTENGTNVGLWTYNGSNAQKVNFLYPYQIKYNANGGSNCPSTQSKDYGKTTVLSSTIPTRTGYTFLGWSTSSSATSATYSAGGNYTANADATLYAVWKANTYTVKYNANGGSGTMSNSSHTYDVSKSLTSNTFTRSGYTFLGWSTSSSATSATYTNGQSVKNLTSTNGGTVNLYAVWKMNDESLSVNTSNNATISIGGEKKYYTFTPSESGTYVIYSTGSSDTKVYLYNSLGGEITSDDDGGTDRNFRLQYDLTAGITYRFAVGYFGSSETGTIPFKLGKVYTVTYNANGGSGAPSTQTKDYGTALTLSSTTPTRAGYTFLGWSTSSTATSATYSAGGTYNSESNTTLYAIWKKNQTTAYTLSYNANGGSGAPSSQTGSTSYIISSTKPTRTGYAFLGWSTSSSATSATYQPGSSITISTNTTLYAVWKANTYTVKYNANGGSGTMSNSNHTYNVSKALTSNAFTRSGYTFLGWSTSSSATSATYTNGQSVKNLTSTNGGTVNLYAVWKLNDESLSVNTPNNAAISTGGEKKYYTFTPSESGTYVIYSTGSSDTKVYLYNSSGTELTSDDDGGTDRNFRLQYSLTAGTTYRFAVGYYDSSATGTIPFKFGKVYTVTYNANSGSGVPATQTKDYGTALTLSSTVPTRAGYTFLGWSTSSTATSATYSVGGTYNSESDATLYAVWKKNQTTAYTLSYNANGGSVTPSSESVTAGNSVTLPTPTKSFALRFNANGGSGAPSAQTVTVNCKGWSTSSSAASASYSCGGSYKPAGNTTLYAVWNSSVSKTLPLSIPSRSGYDFIGWSTNSSAMTSTWKAGDTITVTGNTTLYAVWKKVETPTPPPAPTVEYRSVYLDYKSSYSIDVVGFKAVEYVSEDDSIVSVDSNGTVTAKRPGTADVYVYDANSDVRVVYNFSVDYAWWQWLIIIFLFGWIWY